MKWFQFEADMYMGVAEVKLNRSSPSQSSLVFITNPFDPQYNQTKTTLKAMGYRVVNEGLLWVPVDADKALNLPFDEIKERFTGQEVDLEFEVIRKDTAVQFQRFKNNFLHDVRMRMPAPQHPDLFEPTSPEASAPEPTQATEPATSPEVKQDAQEAFEPTEIAPVKTGANQFIYQPFSQLKRAHLTQPASVATVSSLVLREIQDLYQMNIDDFVAQQLRYSKEELAQYFFAEQVDALALALHGYMQGNGFLVGDGTGSGKSYVLAGMLRFLHFQNEPILFLTESADWYDGFFEILKETGNETLLQQSLLLNNNRVFKLKDGTPVGPHDGKAPASFDFLTRNADPYEVFDTYSAVFGTYALFNRSLPDLRLAEIKESMLANRQEIESLLANFKADTLNEREVSIVRRKVVGHLASYAYNPLSGKDVYAAERSKWHKKIAPELADSLFDFSPEVAQAFTLFTSRDADLAGEFHLLEGRDYTVKDDVFHFQPPTVANFEAIASLATLDEVPVSGYLARPSMKFTAFRQNESQWQFRWRGLLSRSSVDLGQEPLRGLTAPHLMKGLPSYSPLCGRATTDQGYVTSLLPREGFDTVPLLMVNENAESLSQQSGTHQSYFLRKVQEQSEKYRRYERSTVWGFGTLIGHILKGSASLKDRFKKQAEWMSFAPNNEMGEHFPFAVFESKEGLDAIKAQMGEELYQAIYTEWAQTAVQDLPFLDESFVGTLEHTRAYLNLHQALADGFISHLLNKTLEEAQSVEAPEVLSYPFMQSKEQIEVIGKLPASLALNLEHIFYAPKQRLSTWSPNKLPNKTAQNVGMILTLSQQYRDHILKLKHLVNLPVLKQQELLVDLEKSPLTQPIEVRFNEAQNKLTWLYRLTRHENQTPRLCVLSDETHNITNNANAQTARNLLPLMSKAKFAQYATATTGKRFSGVLNYAGLFKDSNLPLLTRILQKGGLRAQENLFLSMVEKGLLCRREQNIGNYTYQVLSPDAYLERSKQLVDQVAPLLNKLNEIGRVLLEERDESKNNFAGRLHLFSCILNAVLNAEQCADEAIASLQRDEKPIVTVDITMDTAILSLLNQEKDRLYSLEAEQEFSDDSDLENELLSAEASAAEISLVEKSLSQTEHGLEIPSRVGVAALLKRSLDSMLKKGDGDVSLSLSSEILVKEFMEELAKLPHIPLSYLDVVRDKIEAAGDYQVAELSRRRFGVKTIEDKDYIQVLPKADKNQIVDGFNSGEIDVLMMSRVGSESISLHACKDFKDQRRRNLIELQPADDVLKRVQFWGRVGRNNSVVEPKISFCFSGLPFEQRLQAMQSQNLLQLGANTSGSINTYKVGVETEAYLSPIGECAALDLLLSQPELADRLGFYTNSLKYRADQYGLKGNLDLPMLEKIRTTLTIRQLIGRACLLSVAEQEQVFEHLNEGIRDFRESYENLGIYFNETKVFDVKAREVKRVAQPFLTVNKDDAQLEVVTYEYERPLAASDPKQFVELLTKHVKALSNESNRTYTLDRGSEFFYGIAQIHLLGFGMATTNAELKEVSDSANKDLHARSVLLLGRLQRSFFNDNIEFGKLLEDYNHNAYLYLGSNCDSLRHRVEVAFEAKLNQAQAALEKGIVSHTQKIDIFLDILQQNLPKAYLLNIYTGELETHMAHKFRVAETHDFAASAQRSLRLLGQAVQRQPLESIKPELFEACVKNLAPDLESLQMNKRQFQALEGNDLLAVEVASQVSASMPSVFTTATGQTIQATIFPSSIASLYQPKVAQLLSPDDMTFIRQHLPQLSHDFELKVGLDSQRSGLTLTLEGSLAALTLKAEANSTLKTAFNNMVSSARLAQLRDHCRHKRRNQGEEVTIARPAFEEVLCLFEESCQERGLNITASAASYAQLNRLKQQVTPAQTTEVESEADSAQQKSERLQALAKQLAATLPIRKRPTDVNFLDDESNKKPFRLPSYEEMTQPNFGVKGPTVKI